MSGVALRTSSARPPAAEHRGFAPEAKRDQGSPGAHLSTSSGTGRSGRTGAERGRWTAPCGSSLPAATQEPSSLKQKSCSFTTDRADDPDGCYSTARRSLTRWRGRSPASGRPPRPGVDGGNEPPEKEARTAETLHHQPGKPAASAIHRALKATASLEDDFSGSSDWHPRTTSPTRRQARQDRRSAPPRARHPGHRSTHPTARCTSRDAHPQLLDAEGRPSPRNDERKQQDTLVGCALRNLRASPRPVPEDREWHVTGSETDSPPVTAGPPAHEAPSPTRKACGAPATSPRSRRLPLA